MGSPDPAGFNPEALAEAVGTELAAAQGRQPGTSAEPSRSRAGRNLPAAVGIGVLLGGLVIGSLAWHRWLFVALATSAVCIGVWEMTRALRYVGIRVPLPPVLAGTIVMLTAGFRSGAEALIVTFALTCVAVLLWRASDSVAGASRDVTAGWFVAAYPSLLAGFSSLLLAPEDGAWRVFTFLLLTTASDVGGYAVGVTLGRHPMAPAISPKKSWEGFVGSIVFCMIAGTVAVAVFLDGRWWVGLALGLAAAVAGTVGDLLESTIKRDVGIKDMSHVLPGHGGLMDRLDSAVVAAPVVWAILAALVPVSGG